MLYLWFVPFIPVHFYSIEFRQQSILPAEALHKPLYRLSHVNAAASFCLQRLQMSICIGVFFNESRVPALVFILIMHSPGVFFYQLSGHFDQNADFVCDHSYLLIEIGKVTDGFDPKMTGCKGFFLYFRSLIVGVNEPSLQFFFLEVRRPASLPLTVFLIALPDVAFIGIR